MIRAAGLALFALMQGAPAPPPVVARMVAVDGARRINLVCAGQGAPTIVLTGGAGVPAATWKAVQPVLAERTRTCAWDRAGFGASDASPMRQTATATTRDLERALAGAKITGPLVLVGHSIGAYETLHLADRLGARVVGMVLVEPSTPDMFRREGIDAATTMAPYAAPFRACAAALRAGAPLAPVIDGVACPAGADARRYDTAVSFFEAAGDSAREVVDPRRSYGPMPLIVLTAGARPATPTPWTQGHADYARLSTRGQQRYVADSGHMMQRERPQAIVVAVRDVVAGVSLSRHTTTR